MLESLKRWIGVGRTRSDGRDIEAWARRRGHSVKRGRDHDGLVIEGRLHGTPWRMEWGVPQRDYILERELRLRMDLQLPADLQMAVLSKALAESLEQQAYSLFTQDTQTRVDSGMPEEMRWLAMFPKISLASMKPLRAWFSVVSANPEPLETWVTGGLARQLQMATSRWLVENQPFVLMTLRGRLYLRTEAKEPEQTMLDGVLSLFEAAAHHALASAEQLGSGAAGASAARSATGTAWGPLPPP